MPPPSPRLHSLTVAALLTATTAFASSPSHAAPRKQVATGKNAFTILSAAVAGIKDDKKIDYAVARSHDTAADPNDREYTVDEMAALADENRGVMALARSALSLPYTPPPVTAISTKLPYLAKFRRMARLLLVDARVKEAHGQWAAGMDSRLDAFALGEKIQANTIILGSLVGIACEAIGLHSEWDNIEHLTAAESKAAARRLEALIASHPPFAVTLVNEQRVGHSIVADFYRAPDPVAFLRDNGLELKDEDEPLIRDAYAAIHRAGLPAAQRDFEEASVITAQRMSGVWIAPSDPVRPPGQLGITRLLLFEISPKTRFKILLGETQARLLLANLAIRAYHLDNNKYPDSLKDLCPKYLKAPPADLFSDNQPLKYGHMGEAPLIYSIGPDGVDDSGQAILSNDAKDDSKRYQVLYESEGDIVGGTNT